MKNKLRQRGSVIIGVVIGFLLCFSIVTSVLLYKNATENKNPNQNNSQNPPVSTPPVNPPQPTSKSGITWLDKPIKVNTKESPVEVYKRNRDLPADLNLLPDDAGYYKVADLPNGSILIDSLLSADGPIPYPYLIRFIETKDKKYTYLANYLDDWMKKEVTGVLLPGVTLENNNIEGLSSPETIISGNKKLVKVADTSQMFEVLNKPTKLLDSAYGPIYEITAPAFSGNSEILMRSLYLKLKDTFLTSYSAESKESALQVYLDVDKGAKSQEQFTQSIVSSCGSGFTSSVPAIRDGSNLISTKEKIGTRGDGSIIYQVKGAGSDLVKQLYKNYLVGRDYEGAPKPLTIDELNATVNHYIFKDSLGDWQLFVNQKYVLAAECGKPVIYLYPEIKTNVSVKVDAKITVSDPAYENGWDVTAYPNGDLLSGGKLYKSLFWEGLGSGAYPNYTGYGFVVPQKDLVTTINNQLHLLGLNNRESQDFLDFWTSKLPNTPYTRLTWFGTRDMDILAPLKVTPQPDTAIRIFLDFEGLNNPVVLQPQKLSHSERQGFTLVEWGGLLRKP